MKSNIEPLATVVELDCVPRSKGVQANGNAGVVEESERADQDWRRDRGRRDRNPTSGRTEGASGDPGPKRCPSPSAGGLRGDSEEPRKVFGVKARLIETAGGYLVLFVLKARSEEEAVQRVLICETRALRCEAEFLGLEGTDELAHAEDAWAMRILNDELFGRGSVALGRI